jgi:hypothetical protein
MFRSLSLTIHKIKAETRPFPIQMITLDMEDFLIELKQLFLESTNPRSIYFPAVW